MKYWFLVRVQPVKTMKLIRILCAFAVTVLVSAEEEPEQVEQQGGRALVMLTQKVLEEHVAEDHEMTMRYTAVNVGNMPATDLKISIPEWPADKFETIKNDITTTAARLEPGAVLEYEFTVKPKSSFKLSSTDGSAQVEYRYGSEETQMGEKVGKTAGFQGVDVLTEKKYQRLTATHVREWTEFGVLSVATWLFPLIGWFAISGSSR